ncbi:acyl-CoA desaturase [Hylemonella sp. W303a]|uniref:acyl-CoA desaturase n=1 Tax=Hylemonella sp. W303a TaxID=3389873 RepID=UPI00396B008B
MRSLLAWFDNQSVTESLPTAGAPGRHVDWLRVLPFIGLHLGCVAVFWTGVSATAVAVALALYAVRMFAITGFYHRYFSHKAFRASRAMQLIFALLGASAAQRGPLWWASHHRHHHAHADRVTDAHSPHHHGLLWSHMGWFLARENFATRMAQVSDLARYPELRFLDRFDVLVPVLLAVSLYGTGEWLAAAWPALGTDGPMLLVWGFCISTVVLYHATFLVNSMAHKVGSRRYAVRDTSRNNFWLALLTFGEGWHNNHHRYPGSARQGFYWWEIDLTYYGLRALAAVGLIRDLRPVPAAIRAGGRTAHPDHEDQAGDPA